MENHEGNPAPPDQEQRGAWYYTKALFWLCGGAGMVVLGIRSYVAGDGVVNPKGALVQIPLPGWLTIVMGIVLVLVGVYSFLPAKPDQDLGDS